MARGSSSIWLTHMATGRRTQFLDTWTSLHRLPEWPPDIAKAAGFPPQQGMIQKQARWKRLSFMTQPQKPYTVIFAISYCLDKSTLAGVWQDDMKVCMSGSGDPWGYLGRGLSHHVSSRFGRFSHRTLYHPAFLSSPVIPCAGCWVAGRLAAPDLPISSSEAGVGGSCSWWVVYHRALF